MNSKTGDTNMTGSKTRLFCDECFNLKRELSLQINAFETLAGLNPNLKSEILVQNLREVLSRVVDTSLTNDVDHVHDRIHVHEPDLEIIKIDACLPPEIVEIPEDSEQNLIQILPQSSIQDEIEECSFQNENPLSSQTSSSVEVVTSTSVMTQGTNERKRKSGVQGKRRKRGNFGRGKKTTRQDRSDDEEWDGLETRRSERQVNKRVTYTNSLNNDDELDRDDNVTMDERNERFIELPPTKSKLSIFKSYKTRQKQTKEQNPLELSLDTENKNQEGGEVEEGSQQQQTMEIVEVGNSIMCNVKAGSFTNNNFEEASKHIKSILIETGCSSYNIYQCIFCDKQMTIWRNACLHILRVHFKSHEKNSSDDDGYSYYKSPFNSLYPNSSTTTTTCINDNNSTSNYNVCNRIVNVWSSPDDTSGLTVLNPFPNFDLKKTLSAHIVVKMLKASRIPVRPPILLPSTILNMGKKRRKSTTKKRRKAKAKFTTRKSHSNNPSRRIYKNTNNNNNNNDNINTKTIHKNITNTNIKIKKPRKIPPLTIVREKKMKRQQLDPQIQQQQSPQRQQQTPKQIQHRRKRKPQKIVRVNQYHIQSLSTINGLNPGAGYTTNNNHMDDYIDPNNPPIFARKSKPSSNHPPPFISSPPPEWNSFTIPNNNHNHNTFPIPNNTTTTTLSPTVESVTAFTPTTNCITGIDRDNWNDLEMNAGDVINLNNSGNTNNTNDSIYNTFAPFLPPPSIMPVHQDHDHLHVSGQSHVSMEFTNEVNVHVMHSPLLPSILPYPPLPYDNSSSSASDPLTQMNGYQADSTSMSLNGNGRIPSELDPYHPHIQTNNNLLQDPLQTYESDDDKQVVEQDPFIDAKGEDEYIEEEDEEEEEEEEGEEEYQEEELYQVPVERPETQKKRGGGYVKLAKWASQKGKLYSRPQKKKASTADVHKQIRVRSKGCFECKACNREFKLISLARGHYRRIHLREQEVQCLNCGHRSTNLGSFKWHLKACTKFKREVID